MRLPALLLSLTVLPAAEAAENRLTLDGLTVAAWAPVHSGEERSPVILFSHGFHGCATQSRYLMEALAAAGYWVFAPNHRDATCHDGGGRWLERPAAPFRHPEHWTDQSYRDRGEDIRRLQNALRQDARFRDRLDWNRLGLAGHSLGGYTMLGLAGAWPSWKQEGIGAVLALSPYAQPFIVQQSLIGLQAPVMYQGGTRDPGVTPAIRKNSGAYALSPTPKYYVEFDGATHFAWSDRGRMAKAEISAYSVAFFDHYLKGEQIPALTAVRAGVAELRYRQTPDRPDTVLPAATGR